jgi:hypothetical protein
MLVVPFIAFGGFTVAAWHCLLGFLVVMGIAAALYGLDRLGLWLEDRGWLYYRRKKPDSSPASMWVAMQQFVEPGVRHVREVRQGHKQEDEEERKERLLAYLCDCLDAATVRSEEVRLYLAAAHKAGLDWREMYAEALRRHQAAHHARNGHVPSADDVTPEE